MRSQTSSTTTQNQSRYLDDPKIRTTDTHIYFLGGILSNWHNSAKAFSGKRALELFLPELDALNIPHPAPDAVTTQLLRAFSFTRGEQWMMAVKAWLFERDNLVGEFSFPVQGDNGNDGDNNDDEGGEKEKESDTGVATGLLSEMLKTKMPFDERKKELWESYLCQILRTKSPKSQKALGRKVPNFREEVWTRASGCIVTAGCVARAEVDEDLRGLYLASGDRVFVEGSRRDRVWGVGLDWKSREILDETKWVGKNRLGECHVAAAKIIQGTMYK